MYYFEVEVFKFVVVVMGNEFFYDVVEYIGNV